jgi:hypothetical protein
MPLLLNLIGIPMAADKALPLRFMALNSDLDSERHAIALRNCNNMIGLRTERYLAYYKGLRQQALYDLEKDPSAKQNIRITEPDLYISMIRKVRSIMKQESLVDGPSQSNLTEADKENLNALGY